MNYCDFVNGINTGIIIKAKFCILDYPHYKNCIVQSVLIDSKNPEAGRIIWFYLTTDGYEKKGFVDIFKEDYKLFRIKGKGSFTLKQIWDRVNILFIQYSSDKNLI